jgi:hypothetical protein
VEYNECKKGLEMQWEHVLALILGNSALIIPLFLWNRAESRSDIRHMDTKLDSNRELIREVHNDTKEMMKAIQFEMKDFHSRLCKIESDRTIK